MLPTYICIYNIEFIAFIGKPGTDKNVLSTANESNATPIHLRQAEGASLKPGAQSRSTMWVAET